MASTRPTWRAVHVVNQMKIVRITCQERRRQASAHGHAAAQQVLCVDAAVTTTNCRRPSPTRAPPRP